MSETDAIASLKWFTDHFNRPNVGELASVQHEHEDEEEKTAELKSLIEKFLPFQAKKHFLHYCLNEDTEDWPDVAENEMVVKDEQENLNQLQKEFSDLCAQIQHAGSRISDIENLEEVIEAIDLKNKETERDELLEQYRKQFDGQELIPIDSLLPVFRKAQEQVAVINSHQNKLKAEIETLEAQMRDIKEENTRIATTLETPMESEAVEQEGSSEISDGELSKDWFLLSSGASMLAWNEWNNVLTATYSAPEAEKRSMIVKITVETCRNGDSKAVSAEVENAPSNIVEWIKNEVENRPEVSLFLFQLNNAWKNEIPLVLEVEKLRESYGVDWLPETRELHVIFGEGTTVELEIGKSYPSFGSVTVKKLRGRSSANVALEDLSLDGAKNLTECVGFLKNRLEN